MGIFDAPKGGGGASNADKNKAGGKAPAGSSAAERAKAGAKNANQVAAKWGRGTKVTGRNPSKPGPKPK